MAAVNQAFCTTQSIPAPLEVFKAGTATMHVQTIAPIAVVWTDFIDMLNAGVDAISVYDGTSTVVDGSTAVWLVLFSKLTTHTWLVKELDYANIGTLLGAIDGAGDYAVYYRIDGQEYYHLAQV